MKARMEWIPGTDSYGLWLWDDAPGGRRMVRIEGNRLVAGEQVEAERVEPTLILDGHMLSTGELQRAISGLPYASDAVVKHLDDARAVRDRLLSLVEKNLGRGG